VKERDGIGIRIIWLGLFNYLEEESEGKLILFERHKHSPKPNTEIIRDYGCDTRQA